VRFSKVIYICEDFTMLRRSLFACALMLAGVVGFASSAKAGSAIVNFPATVSTFCTLGTPVDGQLGVNTTNDILGTGAGYTSTPASAVGTIPLDCSKDTTLQLTVAEVTGPTTGTTMTATLDTSDVDPTVTGVSGDSGASVTLTKNINEPANVDLTVTAPAGTKFIPGDYSYTVTLTSTP
jgi:hypothetical protein